MRTTPEPFGRRRGGLAGRVAIAGATLVLLGAAGPFAVAASAEELPAQPAEQTEAVEEAEAVEQAEPAESDEQAEPSAEARAEASEAAEPTGPAAEPAEAVGPTAQAEAPAGATAKSAGAPSLVNAPPVVSGESLDAVAGQYLAFDAPGVLGNDVDPDGDALELVSVSVPAHGVLYNWSADGSVGYVPNDGFSGTDQIGYVVSDGEHEVSGTVTYHVTEPANYGPDAWSDTAPVREGSSLHLAAPGVLANDSDVDGDALSVVAIVGPSHGTGTIAPDGTVDYTPTPGYVGDDAIFYTITDGTETSSTFLNLEVIAKDAPSPLLALGDHYTAMAGATLDVPAPGLLGNDQAFNPGGIFVDGVSGVDGTILWHADGSFSYTPPAGFTGMETFDYSVTDVDGVAHASAIVSINVLAPAEDCEPAPGDGPTPPSLVAGAVAVPAPEPDCEPTDPEQPGEPEQPGDAEQPSTPTTPEQPAPTEPATVASSRGSALADTGIDLGPILGIPLLAIVIGASVIVARRRKGEQ